MKKDVKLNRYLFEYRLLPINILSVFVLTICLVLTTMIEKKLGFRFVDSLGFTNLSHESKIIFFDIICFIVILGWFILHEIIHGVAYRIMGAKKDNVSYGVVLEKGIFYCKCNDYVNKSCILVSVLAPFVVIGVVTYILGIIFNFGWLVYLSIINIMGACGDLAMFSFFVFRDKDIRFKELDDSTTFCLETTEDLTKKKFLFVKLKKVLEDDIKNDTKNKFINITKPSIFILTGCLVLLVVSVIFVFI